MIVPDWMIVAFGILSIGCGIRAIRKRYVYTDVGEYKDDSAVRWGVMWIVLGSLFILTAIFDIKWFKALVNLFFSRLNGLKRPDFFMPGILFSYMS